MPNNNNPIFPIEMNLSENAARKIQKVIERLPEADMLAAKSLMRPVSLKSDKQKQVLSMLALLGSEDSLDSCHTAEDVELSGHKYLVNCLISDQTPTLSGLSLWFGVTETDLWKTMREDSVKGPAVQRLIMAIRATLDQTGLTGVSSPQYLKWMDESRFGMQPAPIEEKKTININISELEKKYKNYIECTMEELEE